MRLIIQRVKEANVTIENRVHAEIGMGMVVLFGVCKSDSIKECARLAERLVNLRVFSDSEDKMNLSLNDINGSLLIVSQFTLYADCSKGRRPSFTEAAPPEMANGIYEQFLKDVRGYWPKTQSGVFGAKMEIHLVNDGPLTFILEST